MCFKTAESRTPLSKELTQQHRIHSDIPSAIVRPQFPIADACLTFSCQQSPPTLNVLLSNTLL